MTFRAGGQTGAWGNAYSLADLWVGWYCERLPEMLGAGGSRCLTEAQPPQGSFAISASPYVRERLQHSGVEGHVLRAVFRESVLKTHIWCSVGSKILKWFLF